MSAGRHYVMTEAWTYPTLDVLCACGVRVRIDSQTMAEARLRSRTALREAHGDRPRRTVVAGTIARNPRVEVVPFCNCTNEELEAGRTCGLVECPNGPQEEERREKRRRDYLRGASGSELYGRDIREGWPS